MTPSDDSDRSMSMPDGDVEAAIEAFLANAADMGPESKSVLAREPGLADFLSQHEYLVQLGSWWRGAVDPGDTTALYDASSSAPGQAPQAVGGEVPELPGYEILRQVARGGMGVVYEAVQRSLNRRVAVKLILQGGLASKIDQQRFVTEATAVAKLEHPNIVVIHEVGEHRGLPFFSMEYIEGESLAQLGSRGLVNPRQAAQYVHDVAEAVQFAHDHGVLHRDLKPSNVLVDKLGRVRVMDFGLAKQIDADDKLTVTGQLLGTPAYMAPEQASGSSANVGPACDVYGLGAVLFELLTGQPPFCGATQLETLLDVLESDPPLPQQLNPQVPRSLEMIALKCLEKNPADRYASAQEVATDLQRYLDGESLSISSPNLLDRLVRTLQRSKFDQEVRQASRFVLHASWIALATHLAMFLNYRLRSPHPLMGVIFIRLAEIALMLVAFWPHRNRWFPPKGAAARQLWSMWLGYLVGAQVIVAADYLLTPPGEVFYGLRAYPALAVLASLAFSMLGSSYWGYCYTICGIFLALAILMPFWLPAAPLLFGACWSLSLAFLGIRLTGLQSLTDR